jgi:hypothetical protein
MSNLEIIQQSPANLLIQQGIKGDKGDSGILGLWRGAYAGGTAYVVNDIVGYSGATYICKLATTGNLPTNTTYWDVLLSNTLPSAMVQLQDGNGHGSTNNKIRRFSSIVFNVGTDITYADSATLGASFTINTTGVYTIDYSDFSTFSAFYTGISKNSTQLTTSILTITASTKTAAAYRGTAAEGLYISTTNIFTAGDVIRPHTDGQPNGTTLPTFRITRIA